MSKNNNGCHDNQFLYGFGFTQQIIPRVQVVVPNIKTAIRVHFRSQISPNEVQMCTAHVIYVHK